MELQNIETLDFYKACTLLCGGYELISINDFLSGNFQDKVRPLMTFTPMPDMALIPPNKDQHYKVCMRSLYNQLKVKYFMAKVFEFKNDLGWYSIFTDKAIPPYNGNKPLIR